MFTTWLAFAFPAASTVLGWLLFGSIGTIAVGYAKLREEWPAAVLGVALMAYPIVFPSGFWFWLIGIALTALLFVPARWWGVE